MHHTKLTSVIRDATEDTVINGFSLNDSGIAVYARERNRKVITEQSLTTWLSISILKGSVLLVHWLTPSTNKITRNKKGYTTNFINFFMCLKLNRGLSLFVFVPYYFFKIFLAIKVYSSLESLNFVFSIRLKPFFSRDSSSCL